MPFLLTLCLLYSFNTFLETDGEKRAELQFDMNLVSTLCKTFLETVQIMDAKSFFGSVSVQEYLFSFLDLLITFEGTLECRRFFHILLRDHCLLELLKGSSLFKELFDVCTWFRIIPHV